MELSPEEAFFADRVRALYRADEAGRAAAIAEWQAGAARGENLPIACRAGCGACCRHLVPIWEVEAIAFVAAARELPAPVRDRIRENLDRWQPAFEAWLEQAAAAGLDFDPATARTPFSALATSYWREQIPCPFLIDEACSIYADRPVECRYYHAAGTPDACAAPHRLPVIQPEPVQRAGDRPRLHLIEEQRARDDGLIEPQIPLWCYAPAIRLAVEDAG